MNINWQEIELLNSLLLLLFFISSVAGLFYYRAKNEPKPAYVKVKNR